MSFLAGFLLGVLFLGVFCMIGLSELEKEEGNSKLQLVKRKKV